jgi:hypothetical protein
MGETPGADVFTTVDFGAGRVYLLIWTARRRWCGWI